MSRLTDANTKLAHEIIARYPRPKSALIPLLHLSQEQNGFVTREAMQHLGELVGVTSAEVYGTATFYEMFKFEPVGKYLITPITRTATTGAYTASLSIRRGQGTQTHDRVYTFKPEFDNKDSALMYAAAQGRYWLLNPDSLA